MDVFTSHYRIPADGYYLSIMNAASMFGRILPGFVGTSIFCLSKGLSCLHFVPCSRQSRSLQYYLAVLDTCRCPAIHLPALHLGKAFTPLILDIANTVRIPTARRAHTLRHSVRIRIGRPRLPPASHRCATRPYRIRRSAGRQHDRLPGDRIRLSALCRVNPRWRSVDGVPVVGSVCV